MAMPELCFSLLPLEGGATKGRIGMKKISRFARNDDMRESDVSCSPSLLVTSHQLLPLIFLLHRFASNAIIY